MTENKAKTYSLLIKIGIAVVLCIFAIVLLSQFVTIGNLTKQNSNLQQQYNSQTAEYDNLSEQKESIQDNYEQFVTDYARDKFNYTEEDEILINKNPLE